MHYVWLILQIPIQTVGAYVIATRITRLWLARRNAWRRIPPSTPPAGG